jgi:hypothetical protein
MSDTTDLALYGNLYRITNHGGAALLTVVTLCLCLTNGTSSLGSLVSVAILAFAGGLSDPLYAASCGSALLLSGLAMILERFVIPRRLRNGLFQHNQVAVRMLASGSAALIGACLTETVHAWLNPMPKLALAKSKSLAAQAMLHDFSHDSLGRGLFILVSFAISAALFISRRDAKSCFLRTIALWHMTSLLTTLVAMAWTRLYLDAGCQRYLAVPFMLTPVIAAAGLACVLGDVAMRTNREVLALLFGRSMLVVLVGSTAVLLPVLVWGQYRSSWRERAGCVERVLRREGSDVLLADYWKAKPLRLFSNGNVHAVQMRQKLKRPYFWISSRAWLQGKFRFGVVAVNDLDSEAIRARFGEPAAVEQCEDISLFAYRGSQQARLTREMERAFSKYLRDPHPL